MQVLTSGPQNQIYNPHSDYHPELGQWRLPEQESQ